MSIVSTIFGIECLDIEMTDFKYDSSGFFIEIMITNSSNNKYWFHYGSARQLVKIEGNILYFAPNNTFFYNNNNFSGNYKIDIIEINQQETIKRIFHFKNYNYKIIDIEKGTITTGEKMNFSKVEYINAIFLFFPYEMTNVIDEAEYYNKIFMEGLLITKIYKRENERCH
jgi:hypothetical protein